MNGNSHGFTFQVACGAAVISFAAAVLIVNNSCDLFDIIGLPEGEEAPEFGGYQTDLYPFEISLPTATNVHQVEMVFVNSAYYSTAFVSDIMVNALEMGNSVDTSIDIDSGFLVNYEPIGDGEVELRIIAKPILYPGGVFPSDSILIVRVEATDPVSMQLTSCYDFAGNLVE